MDLAWVPDWLQLVLGVFVVLFVRSIFKLATAAPVWLQATVIQLALNLAIISISGRIARYLRRRQGRRNRRNGRNQG